MSRAPAGLTRTRRRPLVDEVRDLIAQDFIFNGAVEPGSLLPSEKVLCEQYGVSRVTLRAGMNRLQEGGLIKSRHGVGWIVLPRPLTQYLDDLSSIDQLAREAGQVVTTRDVEWSETSADDALAAMLGVPPGTPIVAVTRIKEFDGTPVAWFRDCVPTATLDLETLRAEFRGSVLDILLNHSELHVAYSDTELRPVVLSADIASRLGVTAGSAALYLESLALSGDGHPIEWSEGWLLPDHFRFRLKRRRQMGASSNASTRTR